MKRVLILGGGLLHHITNHVAISAPAYGTTACTLRDLAEEKFNPESSVELHFSRMANAEIFSFETVAQYEEFLDNAIADLNVKVIFTTVAVPDFEPIALQISPAIRHEHDGLIEAPFDKVTRLHSADVHRASIVMKPADKLIRKIRQKRKDITLVAFKTTSGATPREMYLAGLKLVKEASVNLVLVNDVQTKLNMVVTPEESTYHETNDRLEALRGLVDMAWHRSQLTFTRSTVVAGEPIPWESELVPETLRTIVNHLIERGAYQPFGGATVGHFAAKIGECEFLTSIRKTNFNDLPKVGLVRVVTDGPDTVLAYGAKPSVGGQSQRRVFSEHPGTDCIVHFHCEMRDDAHDKVPVVSQREVECGSHQCGQNTSGGLKQFEGGISAVMLDRHGPNIVFSKDVDPKAVIDFIERNFDLTKKTGGYQLVGQ